MVLENLPSEFQDINIFEAAGAARLHEINPIHQVPVLVDGEKTIWDSRIIFQYLNAKHKLEDMDWEKENLLTAIDGAMSSGVTLVMSKRSGLKIDEPVMYFTRQHERIISILDHLKPYVKSASSLDWGIINMTLYSFLDWAKFREVINLKERPEFSKFLDHHSSKPIVQQTQLPKA